MIRGYTDPNFANPMGPGDASIIIYGYTPSLVLGVLGAALFACLLLLHTVQTIKYRLWAFSVIPVACAMEIIGYIFRILSSRIDPYRIAFFVGQYFCITCAPVFISAGIYIFLSKLSLWAMEVGFPARSINRCGLNSSRILWTFISSDLICTLLQVTGASLVGNRTSKQKDPTNVNRILIAGLAVQLVSFLLFMLLMITIMVACSKNAGGNRRLETAWKEKRLACSGAVVAAFLVFIRTVFRLVESADGVFGYLSSHEVFFGALEFAPIVISVVLLSIWHPERVLPFPPGSSGGGVDSIIKA